jgi:hypothetical protein
MMGWTSSTCVVVAPDSLNIGDIHSPPQVQKIMSVRVQEVKLAAKVNSLTQIQREVTCS